MIDGKLDALRVNAGRLTDVTEIGGERSNLCGFVKLTTLSLLLTSCRQLLWFGFCKSGERNLFQSDRISQAIPMWPWQYIYWNAIGTPSYHSEHNAFRVNTLTHMRHYIKINLWRTTEICVFFCVEEILKRLWSECCRIVNELPWPIPWNSLADRIVWLRTKDRTPLSHYQPAIS